MNIVFAATIALGQHLQISEAVALNVHGPTDGDADLPDWIEIWNRGDTSVNLEGFSLTDSDEKWNFPRRVLEPGARLVVFASGKDRRTEELHTDFKINSDGETIVFSDPAGVEVDRLTIPEMGAGQAFGRADNDDESGYLLRATPGMGGQIRIDPNLDPPESSIPSGLAFMPMQAVLRSNSMDAEIYFTTDGSDPTASSIRYSGPLEIANSQVIRARVFLGNMASLPATFTWLSIDSIADDKDMDSAVMMRENAPGWSQALSDLPLILLAADHEEMFGETGIYQRYEERGRDVEIHVSGTFVEPRNPPRQIRAGLRIHGGGARQFPKKSFRLYFRDSYGENMFSYPLFSGSPVSRFRQLVLRSGGHDSWSDEGESPVGWPYHATYLRDAFARETDQTMGLHFMRGRFVHVFINARYRGLYNLQERPTKTHFQEHFGPTDSDWQILESDHEPQLDGRYLPKVVEGDIAAWEDVLAAANGPDPLTNLSDLIDLETLIDWSIAHMWAADFDWFGTAYLFNLEAEQQSNNWYVIAPGGESIGRFFPLTWDAEVTLGSDLFAFSPKRTLVGDLTRISAAGTPAEIYAVLRQLPEFQMRFGDRVQHHFFMGRSLDKNTVRNRWESLRGQIRNAVWAESSRWGSSGRETTLVPDDHWQAECDWVSNVFMDERETLFLEQLRQRDLFPIVKAPTADPQPGLVPVDSSVSFSSDVGASIFYTLDGSDPRTAGIPYDDLPIAIPSTSTIHARSLIDDVWSPLEKLEYRVQYDRPVIGDLKISEVLLWPTPPIAKELDAGFDSVSDFVFFEIANVSERPITLDGCTLSGLAEHTFTDGSVLEAGEVQLLANNTEALVFRYQIDEGSIEESVSIVPMDSRGSLSLRDNSGVLLDTVVIESDPIAEFAESQHRSLWMAKIPNAGYVPSPCPDGGPGVKDRRSYDDWLAAHFTVAELADPNLVSGTADPDGDALANLIEFAAGTNPRIASRFDEIMNISVTEILYGADLIRYPEISLFVDASAEVEICIESSHDLLNWESAPVFPAETSIVNEIQTRLSWRHSLPLTGFRSPISFRVRVSIE